MTLKPTTLVFLAKRAENGLISDLCLACKKQGMFSFGEGDVILSKEVNVVEANTLTTN